MIRLTVTQKDFAEMEALIAKHPNTVRVVSATRFSAKCKINVENGAIYWEFADSDDEFTMVKTRLDDNALIFQSGEIFRLAFLRAKEAIAIARAGHAERNERKAANPSPRMLKKRRLAEIKAAQLRLPALELHSKARPGRWKHD